jgi:nucleosome binding factor SPN SPT16 subunit
VTAKILAQIQGAGNPVPVEVYSIAKAKDAPTDAVPRFLSAYTAHQRVGTMLKDSHTGKLIDEWNGAVAQSDSKPELVDMAPAVSFFLAVKDNEELVRYCEYVTVVIADQSIGSGPDCCKPHIYSPCTPYCRQARDDTGPRNQNSS